MGSPRKPKRLAAGVWLLFQRKPSEKAKLPGRLPARSAGMRSPSPFEEVAKPLSPAIPEAETVGADDSPDEHPADKPAGSEPEEAPPGDELAGVADQPVVADEEPDLVAAEPDPIPVLATSRARPDTTGPTVTSAASRTTVMPVAEPAARPVADSYLDDPDQMMTYWIRAALTVAFAMFLVIVLFWALGNLTDSIGEVWDLFKAAS